MSSTGEIRYDASRTPFPKEIEAVLREPVKPEDVSVVPGTGNVYLSEMKYRVILCRAFMPGGWALVPRGPYIGSEDDDDGHGPTTIRRDYTLFCLGQLVNQTRGTAVNRLGMAGYAVATETLRSNALTKLCKDLGIGKEMGEKGYREGFLEKYCRRKVNGKGREFWEVDPGKVGKGE
ncbi:hypothetical protein HK101_004486 [Irineochytrium annulatum]|nr:hypothetical protein HK101_004486 [Irineochytrium annulatum]